MLRYKETVLISAFQLQKRGLLINSSSIAGETAIFSNDPVTGDNDGDLIVPDCAADCLGRHSGQISFSRKLRRDFSIRGRLAIRNPAEDIPDADLKGCADHMQRREEIRVYPSEIEIKPPSGCHEDIRIFLHVLRVEIQGVVFFVIEPESCKPLIIAGEKNFTERGLVSGDILHCYLLLLMA